MFNKIKYKLFLENIAFAYLTAQNIDKYYEDILKYIIETPSKYLLDLTLFKLSISFSDFPPKIELIERNKKSENLQSILATHFNLPHFLLSTFANSKESKYFRLFLLILIKAEYTTFLFRPYIESHEVGSGHTFNLGENNLMNYIINLITYDKSLKTIINKNLNKIIEYNIKSSSSSLSLSSSSSDNLFLKVDFFIKSKKIENIKKKDNYNYDSLKDVLEDFLNLNKTKKLNRLYRLKYFKNSLEIDLQHQPYINPLIKYSKKEKESIKEFMKESYPNIFCNAKKICKNKNKNSKLLPSIIDKIIKS